MSPRNALTFKYVTQMTPSDAELLKKLAEKADCSFQQIGNYALRLFIHEQITRDPSLLAFSGE